MVLVDDGAGVVVVSVEGDDEGGAESLISTEPLFVSAFIPISDMGFLLRASINRFVKLSRSKQSA